jgi:hypothetical protein
MGHGQVWETLMDVVPFLRHNTLKLPNAKAAKDFTAKWKCFDKAYKEAWGIDGTYIHYHHLLGQHLPGQIKKWGAPFIWSASSMEKSHWKAHNAAHTRTQLGGKVGRGRKPTDPLFQLMQYEVRNIFHRIRLKYIQSVVDNLLQKYPGWRMTAKGLRYRKEHNIAACDATEHQELEGYMQELENIRCNQHRENRTKRAEIWAILQVEKRKWEQSLEAVED